MNFGRVINNECVNVPPAPDERCSDPAFALSNPEICGVSTALLIKPGVALTCAMKSIQFRAFVSKAGVETDVTDLATFSCSDLNVAMIGAATGNCTGMSAGEATISVSYNGLTATASLTVLAGDTCCTEQSVAVLVCIDTTRSMNLAFNASYANKLEYAKAAARRFIEEIDGNKDRVGLMTFHNTTVESLAAISSDVDATVAALNDVTQSQDKTEFYDAVLTAIEDLNSATVDRRVILLISDGADTMTGTFNSDNDPLVPLSEFKAQGGIVITVGVRSFGLGMAMLSAMATGGFFLNAYDGVESDVLDFLSGLKGYICVGNCVPEGDNYVAKGKFNYADFLNWNVEGGYVDLQGNGFFDYLPGNGLYVDLQSGTQPVGDPNGRLVSKTPFAVTAGHVYRITLELAGNQIIDQTPYIVSVQAFWKDDGDQEHLVLDQQVYVNDYKQPFQPYAFSFTAGLSTNIYLAIKQLEIPDGADVRVGVLLNQVVFDDTSTLENLLTDNFDTENLTYIPPRCGIGTTYAWNADLNAYAYAVGYNCYGTGCLDEPIPVQAEDPHPLADIESGTPPPQRVYTSTKEACATCPNNTESAGDTLVPEMTSATTPSGEVFANAEEALKQAWRAFDRMPSSMSPYVLDVWETINAVPNYIGYKFAAATVVAGYAIRWWNSQFGWAWKFQGSQDGSNWTDLDSRSGVSFAFGQRKTYTFTNTTAYLYYRLYVTATDSGLGTVIDELEFFGPDAGQACATASATSYISQADADSKAYAAALLEAQTMLNCTTVYTSTQQYEASCPRGTYGQKVTKTATATSTISQADADAKALSEATAAAEAALDCTGSNNNQQITINDRAWSIPVPSVQYVTGKVGAITKVTVTLTKLSHTSPRDIRLGLMSPDGTLVTLMHNVGGTNVISNVNLTIDDAAASNFPLATIITSGTYKPTDNGAVTEFPPPIDDKFPYETTLASLIGENPNGAWSLWVYDDVGLDVGSIFSWSVTITSA